MSDKMQVSVIIPVYNAASFVAQAVESALQQHETAEVVLVEDGSPDNGWEVCQQLAAKYDRVHLFRHPDGRNRGAGASRNLGMQKSSGEFIAFLDADDYYLPGRFSAARVIFDANPDCEGVYEATGLHIDNQAGLERWAIAGKPIVQLITMSRRVGSEELWDALISGTCGYSHLDGLVLRSSVLGESGYMAQGLRLHQDTEFMIRVAITAKLLPGRLDEPVAMVRVHDQNRISAPRSETQKHRDRMLFWTELYGWCKRRRLSEVQLRIMDRMVLETIGTKRTGNVSRWTLTRRALGAYQLLKWSLEYPKLVLEPQLWMSMKGLSVPVQRRAAGKYRA